MFNMNYKFFNNSERAWRAMFESMSGAQESIYLEMYIFQNDMEKFNFFDLLKEKARSGLRVKLILDSFGSFGLRNSAVSDLKKNGVEILFLSYLLHRTHRKILVIDESVAFVGGVNIHQTAKFWNDIMIRIKGDLVKNIIWSFVKSYKNAGGRDPILLAKNKKMPLVEINSWIVEHSPIRKKFKLKKVYKKYINKAEESITLVTPYFMPKRWLSAVLHQAVLRGVNVEILVPRDTDHFILDRVNYFYIYKLAKLGIKFYLEPGMNHAKVIIVDKIESMVGSQNLDFLSFDFNSEISISFKEKEVISELCLITRKWKEDAVLFDFKTYKPKWSDYILSPFIKLFFRIF